MSFVHWLPQCCLGWVVAKVLFDRLAVIGGRGEEKRAYVDSSLKRLFRVLGLRLLFIPADPVTPEAKEAEGGPYLGHFFQFLLSGPSEGHKLWNLNFSVEFEYSM